MATCRECGQRLAWGGRRFIRIMKDVDTLISDLKAAHHSVRSRDTDVPIEASGVVLEIRSLLDRLIYDGGRLIGDLHEAAHDSGFLLDRHRARQWQLSADRALNELAERRVSRP